MVGKYKTFKYDDEQRSKTPYVLLGLTDADVYSIDSWFSLFLQKHSCTKNTEEELLCKEELEVLYREIETGLSITQHKYALPKLIKYFNILNTGYLRSAYVAQLAILLESLILQQLNTKKVCYNPAEFIFITEYLKSNFFVSPNGKLIETILKLDKKDKIISQATPEQKFIISANILSIIADKGFHHDIICFKKILDLVTHKDIALIEYIKAYKVKNKQGCYEYLSIVLNAPLDDSVWRDFCLKKQLIIWLDSSNGIQPKESWINKLTSIKEKVSTDKLLSTCRKISDKEELQKYCFNTQTCWGDVVCKRFLKAAKWAEEQ